MKKVLVVVDMQKDFVDGALGTKEAAAIMENVVQKIREFDGEIFVTRDTHQENYLETQEGKNLPVVHCVENTAGWQLDKQVEAALKEKSYQIFDKPTFGSVKLMEALKNLSDTEGIEEICFIGLCTGICVISNALLAKAAMPDVPIVVEENCCACVTPDSHKTALEAIKLCQIGVIS